MPRWVTAFLLGIIVLLLVLAILTIAVGLQLSYLESLMLLPAASSGLVFCVAGIAGTESNNSWCAHASERQESRVLLGR